MKQRIEHNYNNSNRNTHKGNIGNNENHEKRRQHMKTTESNIHVQLTFNILTFQIWCLI
jgi:hypothetical protein